MIRIYFTLILLLSSLQFYAQTDIDMAIGKMECGEAKEAFEQFYKSALKANVVGQFFLAQCYEKGYGVEIDTKEAFRYYRKTAEKGLAVGQAALANCYLHGIGVNADTYKASYWKEKSRGKYKEDALTFLDRCYANGLDYLASNTTPQTKGSISSDVSDVAYTKNKASQKNSSETKPSNRTKETVVPIIEKAKTSDVDTNIPLSPVANNNSFVLIVANENYQEVSKVPFAINDGNIFAEYCGKTLGIPSSNISFVKDATLNNIRREMNWLKQVLSAYNGEASVIVYYAGHGIPDETGKTSYILPIDGIGNDVSTGYSLQDLYSTLSSQPAKHITVFLDACFSGGNRDGSMLASARGVAIKAKQTAPTGNLVVFSAAQGDETAYPYKEKQHGLFTYYLLKKIKDSKGDVSLGELGDYVSTEVKRQSIVTNKKSQTPTVSASASLGNNWKTWKLR